MKKVIVTLQGGATATVEVPDTFPKKRGVKTKAKKIERSVFGAIRLFPGIPKAVSEDELEFIKLGRKELFGRLEIRKYVESKRVDYKGATEADIEALAEAEGIGHLDLPKKIEVLVEREKIKTPTVSTETRILSPKKNGNGGTTKRKPK